MGKVRFQLPAAEDELWYQVVVRLLDQRNSDEEKARDHLRLLEELAFHHRFCGKRLTYAFAEDTATWLAKERDFGNPRDKAQGWLRDLVDQWELLVRRGSGNEITYEFAIPMLDEYFAARHLAARWAEGDKRYRMLIPCRRNWWWQGRKLRCPNLHCHNILRPFSYYLWNSDCQEVILLLAGMVEDATPILRHIARELDDRFNQMLILLAKVLGRAKKADKRVVQKTCSRLMNAWRRSIVFDQSILDDAALTGLARAKEPGYALPFLNALKEALKDKDRRVRLTAVSALGKIGDASAVLDMIVAIQETAQDPERWIIDVLHRNQYNDDAWNSLGWTLWEREGNVDDAMICFDHAISENWDSTMAWVNKGIVLKNIGHYDEALCCYKRAVEIPSSHSEDAKRAWYNMANLYWEKGGPGHMEETKRCLNEALKIDPNYSQALMLSQIVGQH